MRRVFDYIRANGIAHGVACIALAVGGCFHDDHVPNANESAVESTPDNRQPDDLPPGPSHTEQTDGAAAAVKSGSSTTELSHLEQSRPTQTQDQVQRVQFDDLELRDLLAFKPLPADFAERIPDRIRRLEGATIRINGHMRPQIKERGISRFVLACPYEAGLWTFGVSLRLDRFVFVTLMPEVTTDFTLSSTGIDVVGTFRIELLSFEGEPCQLYWLDDARIVGDSENDRTDGR